MYTQWHLRTYTQKELLFRLLNLQLDLAEVLQGSCTDFFVAIEKVNSNPLANSIVDLAGNEWFGVNDQRNKATQLSG